MRREAGQSTEAHSRAHAQEQLRIGDRHVIAQGSQLITQRRDNMKTSELTGAALDWAVAKCEWRPERVFLFGEPLKHIRISNREDLEHTYVLSMRYEPSTNWSQGGPIIEREGITLIRHADKTFWWASVSDGAISFSGPTPLIAAMRCYVASKLGDEVDVPTELTSYE
jgi:hypothetical protein